MDFNEFGARYRIQVIQPGEHHHVRQGWIGLDCPLCSPDSKKFRLGWKLGACYFSCWVCGKVNMYEVIKLLSNETDRTIKYLCYSLRKDRKINSEDAHLIRKIGTYKVPHGVGELKSAHIKYLKKRGITKSQAKFWQLQGTTIFPVTLNWRIFAPITLNGENVSWTTRSITSVKDKYKTARPEEESVFHKNLLFGMDHVRDVVIVHEGLFDVIRTGPGSVATLGVNFSNVQMAKLSKIPKRIICFDNEPQAKKKAEQLANSLACCLGKTYLSFLETGKDASDADEAEIKELRKLLYE